MKNLKQVLGLAILIGFTTNVFGGGPWLEKKGNGYFQIGGNSKVWDGRYQGTYSNTFYRDLNRKVRESFVSAYAEYGLTSKITLVGELPFRQQSTSNDLLNGTDSTFSTVLPKGSLVGWGNPSLGMKIPLKTDGLKMAAQLRYWFNASSYNATAGLRSDYDAASIMPSIFIGNSGNKHYWSFDAGFLIRGNNYGESIMGNGQYGYSFWENGYLIIDMNYVFTLENGTHDDGTAVQTATFLDNQGYVSYGLKWYQKLSGPFSFNVAAYSGFAVVNQGTQPGGIFGGFAYELKK
ncbi:MAG: hypothetical protein KDC92_10540 [Bacteroidetes bacterium]|nr:hypothetical protein [Bacteroidota bacterium]